MKRQPTVQDKIFKSPVSDENLLKNKIAMPEQ